MSIGLVDKETFAKIKRAISEFLEDDLLSHSASSKAFANEEDEAEAIMSFSIAEEKPLSNEYEH